VERPGSRASFDFNYQDYSASKAQTNNNNQATQPTSTFKKNSQHVSKTLSPIPNSSMSNK